ncbi:MAG TPA: hypothetical protein VFR32_00085 [Gaiellaceae bacterium]|nr:hypothetical protein [Gaiellaceae bacterium]
MLHGSSYPTYDIDVYYEDSPDNLLSLLAALGTLGAEADIDALRTQSRIAVETPYGPLHLFSRIDGAPGYAALKAAAGSAVEVESVRIFVASIDHLIAMKEAAGRPKDRLMATEYRVLSDELRAPRGD